MATADDILPGLIQFLSVETGRNASAMKKTTKLSALGIDGFVLARIGQDINKTGFLHGGQVTLQDLQPIDTVGALADLLAKRIRP
jgi:hypothetical protein